MEVLFVSSVAPIVSDPEWSARFYRDTLGLPLEGDGYIHTDKLEGAKHFGVWPLQAAAVSCFGTDRWPPDIPVPQASIEFELASPEAVGEGAAELEAAGHRLLHGRKDEEWGQTVARLLTPDGLLVGLSYAPWMH